jgi:hypothetical protein
MKDEVTRQTEKWSPWEEARQEKEDFGGISPALTREQSSVLTLYSFGPIYREEKRKSNMVDSLLKPLTPSFPN